jgi:hypothetical protein
MPNPIHKTSPSPRPRTSNKENLRLPHIPFPSISFRNLDQTRKRKDFNQILSAHHPHHEEDKIGNKVSQGIGCHSSTPLTEQKCKLKSDKDTKMAEKSIDDYRLSLKSKDKQMASLHSQVISLTETVVLLKEQLGNIKH